MVAATAWWHLGNAASRFMTALVCGAFGSLAWSVPVLAGRCWPGGSRVTRTATRRPAQLTIGASALLIGGLGLVHIAHGTPPPTDAAMRAAGGFIGYAASAPLVAAADRVVAARCWRCCAAFGLLVITGTPLHRVPDRLAELRGVTWRGQTGPPAGRYATAPAWLHASGADGRDRGG